MYIEQDSNTSDIRSINKNSLTKMNLSLQKIETPHNQKHRANVNTKNKK